jgi:hypothetical protein
MRMDEVVTNQQVIVRKARGYTQRGRVLSGRTAGTVLVDIPSVGCQEWHAPSKLVLA